jgi:predicted lipid-binding transport protein (Tim44 family)
MVNDAPEGHFQQVMKHLKMLENDCESIRNLTSQAVLFGSAAHRATKNAAGLTVLLQMLGILNMDIYLGSIFVEM